MDTRQRSEHLHTKADHLEEVAGLTRQVANCLNKIDTLERNLKAEGIYRQRAESDAKLLHVVLSRIVNHPHGVKLSIHMEKKLGLGFSSNGCGLLHNIWRAHIRTPEEERKFNELLVELHNDLQTRPGKQP